MPEIDSHDQRKLPAWCIALPFLAVLVVYGQSVAFEFQEWDDRMYLLENPVFKLGFVDALKVILVPGAMPDESLYIPIPYLSFLVDATCWGLKSGPAHAINVLLHGLNGVLVLLILHRLLKNRLAAVTGALVFVLHPLQVESVVWAFSRRELLAGAFLLTAVLSYVRHLDAPSKTRYALALGAFLLALLCKPNVFLVFLAFPLLAKMKSGRWSRRSLYELLPFAAVAAACVVVNTTVEEGSQLSLRAQMHQLNFLPFMITEWVARITCILHPFPYYLRTELTGDKIAWFYLIVPGVLVAIGYATIRLKAWRTVAFAAFALLAIAPAGAIVIQANRYFYTADRYAYVAMLGVAGLVAVFFARLPDEKTRSIAAVVPLFVGLAILCFLQVRVWQNSVTMNGYALVRNRDNAIALSFLALDAYTDGDDDRTRALATAALNADPFHATATRLRYLAAKRSESPSQDRYFYRWQLARYGWDYVAYVRASEFDANNDTPRAMALLDRVLAPRRRPVTCPDIYFLYGKITGRNRQFDASLTAYQRGLELVPDRTAAWFNMGMTAMQGGRWPEAEQAFGKVLAQSPEDAEAMLFQGIALMNQGRHRDAIERLNAVKSRMPKHPTVYSALIDAYTRSGDTAAAQAVAEDARRNGVALP